MIIGFYAALFYQFVIGLESEDLAIYSGHSSRFIEFLKLYVFHCEQIN
ncbi:protein of unknown function [Shewanella benthica]|uniref:Uncharacterized protein n=1 Tax=Shewanella benthica TaxID=43661 RepID=A0A330M907_9GAMM|nr:protein of unknown function [Shewanella benthica]